MQKKGITKLPSVGTRSRFMSETLILAHLQVSEEMLYNIGKDTGNCLHGDETTKITDIIKTFSGLSEMASGDAASTLSSLTEIFYDICDILDTKERKKTLQS